MTGSDGDSGWRNHSTPLTLQQWLQTNFIPKVGACIERSVVYKGYVAWCCWNLMQPVNAAGLGKIVKRQFPHLTTRRLGTRGQSKYHYYGLSRKCELESPSYNNRMVDRDDDVQFHFNMDERFPNYSSTSYTNLSTGTS